jgi:hypothetical protein
VSYLAEFEPECPAFAEHQAEEQRRHEAGELRQALYKQGELPYCQWCVETGDWDNHADHAFLDEMDREGRINAHVEIIAMGAPCSWCHMTEDKPGEGCRAS